MTCSTPVRDGRGEVACRQRTRHTAHPIRGCLHQWGRQVTPGLSPMFVQKVPAWKGWRLETKLAVPWHRQPLPASDSKEECSHPTRRWGMKKPSSRSILRACSLTLTTGPPYFILRRGTSSSQRAMSILNLYFSCPTSEHINDIISLLLLCDNSNKGTTLQQITTTPCIWCVCNNSIPCLCFRTWGHPR
jgi:hypothetical protein